MEGVIYQHTVEAFDATRPKALSLERWLALLHATAKRLSPNKALDDALEELGREMIRGYLEGLVGLAACSCCCVCWARGGRCCG